MGVACLFLSVNINVCELVLVMRYAMIMNMHDIVIVGTIKSQE